MPRTTIFHSRLLLALAWALPATVPAVASAQEAQRPATHTVRRGDTLWDLAQHYLGDPFLWPQIYRINTDVVEDPHWIYPGEVLRLVPGDSVRAVPDEDTPAPPADSLAGEPVAGEPGAEAWGEDEYPMPEFAKRRSPDVAMAIRAYVAADHHALREGEFYSAPFLTEDRALPYGVFLGPVTPPQIRGMTERQTAAIYTTVGVRPPAGGEYAVGDTLLVVQRETGFRTHGDMVIPTGLLRVTGHSGGQVLAEVIALFGAMRQGQEVLPAERFNPGPKGPAVASTDGLSASVLGARQLRELKNPMTHIFLDIGRDDGVAPGDVFEIRREPGPRPRAAESIDELIARGQVVHVSGRSATILLLQVVAPDIPPGTPARRVARLPS